MSQKPFVSIIIPTYNRGDYLPLTLDSFIHQSYFAECYEIIISNNNSTDNTQEIIDEYCEKYKNIKSCFVEKQGVHYARNSAALRAQGDILYFSDDDMIADEFLIENLISVFEKDPKIGAATGKVLPKWQVSPPGWVEEICNNSYLSLLDLGEDILIKSQGWFVFSCHQAIKKEVFLETGGFNPENTGGEWVGDGESGLNKKIQRLGYKFGYVGASVIYHITPESRMTQKYLNKRLANQGASDSYAKYKAKKASAVELFGGVFFYIIKYLLNLILLLFNFSLLQNNHKWRLKRANLDYFLMRIKYDFRLITDSTWRELVLKDNWLEDCSK